MAFGGLGGLGDIVALMGIHDVNFSSKLNEANLKAEKTAQTINKVMNVALLAGAAAFATSVIAAMKFESAFAGVTKTVDGLRDPMGKLNADGEALAMQFRKLALEIPVSVNELAKIGELGGQLGIPKASLIDFTDTIAKLGVTTNLSAEEASTSLARFVNITKQVAPAGMEAGEQIARIGSTIVELGNNFATTEQEVVNFAMRIAGAGAQVGLSQSEILSFGAALSSVGLNAEAGGTAISKLFIDMANQVATSGDKLELFAKIAGTSVDEFKNKFETDAAGAITQFIAGMGGMSKSGENVFGILEELGYTEVRLRDAILRSSAASDLLTESFELGSNAYKENTALAQEAEQRFGTFESQLVLFKNILQDVFITIGNQFLPVLSSTLKTLNEHPAILKTVTVAFAGLAMTIGGLVGVAKTIGILKTSLDTIKGTVDLVKKSVEKLEKAKKGLVAASDLVHQAQNKVNTILKSGGESTKAYEKAVAALEKANLKQLNAQNAVHAAQGLITKAMTASQPAIKAVQTLMKTGWGPVILAITAVIAIVVALVNIYKKHREQVLANIDMTSDEIIEVNSLTKEYELLSQKVGKSAKDSEDMVKLAEQIKEKFKEQGKEIDITAQNIGSLADEYSKLRLEELRERQEELNNKIKEASTHSGIYLYILRPLGDALSKVWNTIKEWKLVQFIGDIIRTVTSSEKLREIFDKITKPIKDAWNAIKNFDLGGFIKDIYNTVTNIETWRNILNDVKKVIKDVWTWVKNLATDIANLAGKVWDSITSVQFWKDLISNIVQKIKDVVFNVENWAKALGVFNPILKLLGIGVKELKLKEHKEELAAVEKEMAELTDTEKKLAAAGVETDAVIRKKLAGLEALLPGVDKNSVAYKNLVAQINPLREELGLATIKIQEKTKALGDAKTATDLLKDAGIETTKMVQDQIKELEKLVPIVGDDAYALAQLKAKEDELYSSMAETFKQAGDITNWIKYYQMTEEGQQKLKENAEAGLKVRDSLVEQQDKLKGTKDALGLYQSVITTTVPIQESSYEKFLKSVNAIQSYGNEVINAAGKLGLFGDKTDLVQSAFGNFMNAIKDQTADSLYKFGAGLESVGSLISGFSGKTDKAGQAAGLLTSTLGTVLKGGFDPLSLGISVVTGLFGIFGGKEEVVVRSTEEVIDSLGLLGDEIESTRGIIDGLADTIQSGMIDALQDELDGYIENLRTAQGSNRTVLEGLVADTQQKIEELVGLFTFDIEFTGVLDGLQKLNTEFARMADYYGTAALEQMGGSLSLLMEKFNEAIYGPTGLGNLDPLSQAWQDMTGQISNTIDTVIKLGDVGSLQGMAINLVSLMNSTTEGTAQWEYYRQELEKIQDAIIELGDNSLTLTNALSSENIQLAIANNAWLQMKANMLDQLAALTPLSNEWIEFTEREKSATAALMAMGQIDAVRLQAIYMQDLMSQTAQGSEEWNTYFEILQQASQALYDAGVLTAEEIAALEAMGISLELAALSSEKLAAGIDKSTASTRGLKTASDEAVADGITSLGKTVDSVTISVCALDDKFRSSITTLEDVIKETARLNDYYGGFDSTNLTNQLQEQIILNLQLLEDLPKGSQAYNDLAAMIFKAYLQTIAMGGSTEGIVAAAEAMGFSMQDLANIYMGVTTETDKVTQAVEKQKNKFNEMNSNGINDVVNNFSKLKEEVTKAIEPMERFEVTLDNTKNKFDEISSDGINEVIDEIEELSTNIYDLDDSFQSSFKSLQQTTEEVARLNEYYGGFDAENLISQLEDQIGLNLQLLSTLPQESAAYDDMSTAIIQAYLQMQEMGGNTDELIALAASLGIDLESLAGSFDNTTEAIEETTESLSFLDVQWDDTIKAITGQYTQFEQDVKEASAIIDELLKFNVDLSTTDMDEQLLASIIRMQEYLGTLDPSSPAYADAKASLDELIAKFQEIGGDVSLVIDTEEANQKLLDQISAFEDQKQQIDMQLALDLEPLQADLETAQAELNALIAEKTQTNIEFELQIAEREGDIATLDSWLEKLGAYREALSATNNQQINMTTSVDELNQGLIVATDSIPALDFYELAGALSEVTGQSVFLAEQWNQMMDDMFGEYDEFSEEMKAASAMIEKLLYFKTDLDTTDADEKMNAMIFKMQDYLGTLDPSSQAYVDAQASLDELIAKYIEMGGALDEQAAIDFNEEQIKQAVDDTNQTIQDILDEQEAYNIEIDPEITKATEKIEEISQQIQDLKDQAELDKLEIDAQIEEAQQKITDLGLQIENIVDQTEQDDINLGVDTTEADGAIAILDDRLDDINDNELFITPPEILIDTTEADDSLSILEDNFNYLNDNQLLTLPTDVLIDITEADEDLAILEDNLDIINDHQLLTVPDDILIDTTLADTALNNLQDEMQNLKDDVEVSIYPEINPQNAYDKLNAIKTEYENLKTQMESTFYPNMDIQKSIAGLEDIEEKYGLVKTNTEQDIEISINNIPGSADLDSIDRKYDEIRQDIEQSIQLDIDDYYAMNIIDSVESSLDILEDHNIFSNAPDIDIDASPAERAVQSLKSELNSLDNVQLDISSTGVNIAIQVSTMHKGGLVEAHGGLLANDEVLAKLKEGEYVHPDYQVAKYPEQNWEEFRVTGDPMALMGGMKERERKPETEPVVVRPYINIENANRWTNARVYNDSMYEQQLYNTRKLEVPSNPF